jgi:ribosomal protein S18 acetylase RimI-like enzyme
MVEIIPFESRYQADFKRLNIAWLEKFFRVEPIDEEVLSDPEARIIGPGGHILFARLDEEIVGACALIAQGGGRFELSKMAVDERHQGLGLGRRLLEAAVATFKEVDGAELFLESNSSLGPAIRLYETSGFRHEPRPAASHYERADVYMVYRG